MKVSGVIYTLFVLLVLLAMAVVSLAIAQRDGLSRADCDDYAAAVGPARCFR